MKLKLVDEWKRLGRAWSMWAAAAGILLPDVLQVIADNSGAVPWLDDGKKNTIRLACLVAVVLLRPIKQKALREMHDETDSH